MRVAWSLVIACASCAVGELSEVDEAALLRDTVAASRGDREAQGVRDQWSAKAGIGSREDARAPVSKKVRAMMRDNGLTCAGCSQREAVEMVNAFIKREQVRLAAEARREKILDALAPVALLLAAGLVLAASVSVGIYVGGAGAEEAAVGDDIKAEIKRTQASYAEALAAAKGAPAPPPPPTWRDREEREVWTPRQEKQFDAALAPLIGLPPKERWPLVAEKVEGKTKGECAAHHKLRRILEAEAAAADGGGDDGLRRRRAANPE